MTIISKIIIPVLLIFLSSRFSYAQIDGFIADSLNAINYTEELIVRTDRDIYIVGESVLLKVFKLNGITHTPGNISQVVYVELLDNSFKSVIQLKIGVHGVSGSGALILPDTLRTGNYFICSYTHWMQNFSSDLFSFKRISVINPYKDIGRLVMPANTLQTDSVEYYPEGGSLVSGIKSVVGFRCFQENGGPGRLNGFLINSNNDTLCRVQSGHDGYGLFSVTPSLNTDLFIITGEKGKSVKKFPLPPVNETGVVISTKTNPEFNFLILEIKASRDIYNDTSRFSLLYRPVSLAPVTSEISIKSGLTELMLNKENLPDGLAQILLIDDSGFPVASRWVYNSKKGKINYSVRISKSKYSTREKVKIGISGTDADGKPLKSDLFVSVIKSLFLDTANCGNSTESRQLPLLASMESNHQDYNINDYLIFYSDMRSLNGTMNSGADVISSHLPELRGHIISGTIKSSLTGKALDNEFVVLSFVGETAKCQFAKTDNKGCFNFVINEYGKKELVIQPLSPEIGDYYVELNNPFPLYKSRYLPIPFYPDSSKLDGINKAVIAMQVKNIYDPYLKKSPVMSSLEDEQDFYGEPVDTILVSQYIELNSMKEIIKEIIPGVSIIEQDGKSKFKIISEYASYPFDNDPLMLIDGVPVNDIDLILTLNPGDLQKVEILKNRYLISDIVIEGIIHFITKKGNLGALEFKKPLFRQEFDGLLPIFSYDYPDYSTDTIATRRLPDFRNTLYWNPSLISEDSGETAFEFYTSDESGEYIIVVEGMTMDGRIGRIEIPFLVEEKPSVLQ